jgi:hypothetical protein
MQQTCRNQEGHLLASHKESGVWKAHLETSPRCVFERQFFGGSADFTAGFIALSHLRLDDIDNRDACTVDVGTKEGQGHEGSRANGKALHQMPKRVFRSLF